MKKLLLALLVLTILSSLQAVHAGGDFVSSVHFDDDDITHIELDGIIIDTETKNIDIVGQTFDIEFVSENNTYLCQGSEMSITEQVMDGSNTTRLSAKCAIESSKVPEFGDYDINTVFPSDNSLDFSMGKFPISTLQIDTDQGYFSYENHRIQPRLDGIEVILRLRSTVNIEDLESYIFEIKSSMNSEECEGALKMENGNVTVNCILPVDLSEQEDLVHNFIIEVENPWGLGEDINYAIKDMVYFSYVTQDFSDIESRNLDTENTCVSDTTSFRNSLTISNSGIDENTRIKITSVLGKFYGKVETRFDTFEMQSKVYNEILERIELMKKGESLSTNAKNILLVLSTSIGYRIDEQKNVFSCEEYGVDFESLLDVNFD